MWELILVVQPASGSGFSGSPQTQKPPSKPVWRFGNLSFETSVKSQKYMNEKTVHKAHGILAGDKRNDIMVEVVACCVDQFSESSLQSIIHRHTYNTSWCRRREDRSFPSEKLPLGDLCDGFRSWKEALRAKVRARGLGLDCTVLWVHCGSPNTIIMDCIVLVTFHFARSHLPRRRSRLSSNVAFLHHALTDH